MGEAIALIPSLPPWAQAGANVAVFVLTVILGILAFRHGRAKPADDDDHHDAKLILAADPVKAALTAIVTLGDNARLQTEALKTIAAASTVYAKLAEPGFLELHVFKAVHEQLREERRNRAAG